MSSHDLLRKVADDLASVVSKVNAEAKHDRWQAGIGPFEEENQIEMLRDAVEGETQYTITTEEPYHDGGHRCDLGPF